MVEAYRAGDGAATERNKAIIRRWVEEGWNKQISRSSTRSIPADVCQHDPNSPPVTSSKGLKDYIGALTTALPDLRFTIESLTPRMTG